MKSVTGKRAISGTETTHISSAQISSAYLGLHDSLCRSFQTEEPTRAFAAEVIEGPGNGISCPNVLTDGVVFEKAAVLFTHAQGAELPAGATCRRPHLAGHPFEAISVSVVAHPRNPYVPSAHLNVRVFLVKASPKQTSWWVGGGFDLTPFYPYKQDVIDWHRAARDACLPYGENLHHSFKQNCDTYFFLSHRKETRGAGGIFFDDHQQEGGLGESVELTLSVAEHFQTAYTAIVTRRKDTRYGERERKFQSYRRARYAEFILLYDRGTRYGLQSGRRVESVLACLPPVAEWIYQFTPEPDSPEARLVTDYFVPRDWLAAE